MKIEKKVARNKPISTKVTEEQNAKLEKLAEKHGVKKSALLFALIEDAYKRETRNKTF